MSSVKSLRKLSKVAAFSLELSSISSKYSWKNLPFSALNKFARGYLCVYFAGKESCVILGVNKTNENSGGDHQCNLRTPPHDVKKWRF